MQRHINKSVGIGVIGRCFESRKSRPTQTSGSGRISPKWAYKIVGFSRDLDGNGVYTIAAGALRFLTCSGYDCV